MISADIMTAIVTPFGEDGSINFDGLEKLTNHLIDTGSRGFVIGGTTGETPTLSHDEKIELYTRFAQIVNGRGTIIAGTGSNNTAETVQLTAEVGSIPGIDYALVVVPYYNKPNQRGMVAHFTAVAEQSPVPLIIYNIPGRTGVTMANDTVIELSHNANIAGVKHVLHWKTWSIWFKTHPMTSTSIPVKMLRLYQPKQLVPMGLFQLPATFTAVRCVECTTPLNQGMLKLQGT